MKDPNEKVNGRGIKILKEAGIEVVEHILEDESLHLNKRFVTYHIQKRPYIFLKWAQTKNGFMDILRSNHDDYLNNYWITNEALRVWSHKLRSEEQAILVGYNTVKNDKPLLTNRLYGTTQPKGFVLYNVPKPTMLNKSFSYLTGNLNEILEELYTLKIQSLIVEGGKKTLQKFLAANLWDEAFVLSGNVEWVAGVEAPLLPCIPVSKTNIDNDLIEHYFRK